MLREPQYVFIYLQTLQKESNYRVGRDKINTYRVMIALEIYINQKQKENSLDKMYRVRILEMREVSYQEKGLKNVTENRHCQFGLSHSFNAYLEKSVP